MTQTPHDEAQKSLTHFICMMAPKLMTPDEIKQTIIIASIHAACERWLSEQKSHTNSTY